MHNHRDSRSAFRPSTFAVLVSAAGMTIAASLFACDSPSTVSPENANIASIHAAHTKGSNPTADYNKMLAQAKAATAKYHNVDAAVADGYVPDGFGCISDPVLGGMGIHYINLQIDADPSVNIEKPELLLYEPDKHGKLKLVGVEYEVFQADWANAGNANPPKLFGAEFEAIIFPGLDPLYGLHVWLWRNNPENMIQSFNKNVSCTL